MADSDLEARAREFFDRMLASDGIKDPEGIDPEYLAWLFQLEEQTRAFMVNARDYMIYRMVRDDSSPVMLRVVFLSPSAQDILGLEDPYRLEDWFAITHPEDVQRIIAANVEAFSSFRLNEQGRIFNRRKGQWRWIHVMGTGSPDITGLPMYANGIIYDITEQKEAALALKDREERLSLAMEASNAATFEFHFDDFSFYPDEKLLFLLRLPSLSPPLTLEKVAARLHAEDRETVVKDFMDIRDGVRQGYDHVTRVLTEDKRWIWVGSRGKVVETDGNGMPSRLMGVVTDITERKLLEDRLQQVYRMEAVGTMAAGIAHDFNNILSPIMGFAELAAEELGEGDPARESVTQIMKAARRAQDLVKQILTVGRQYVEKLRPLSLATVLRDSMRLIRASIPSTMAIRLVIDDSCGRVMGDATQLTQVILNICTNAYQAMLETGGTLSVTLTEEQAAQEGTEPRAVLRIRDEGEGMTEEVRNRIFEPYFSTKGPGEGTGMGLALVHAIISRHGGDIQAASAPGEGAVFTVSLPVIGAAETEGESPAKSEISRGSGHVLLVEDEPQVLTLGVRMLTRLGYRVSSFPDGPSALEAFSRSPGDFDAVMTDMTMPKMTGKELAERIKNIRPEIPIVLCTGFAGELNEEQADVSGISGYIKKPAQLSEISHVLQQVLGCKGEADVE